MFWAKSDRAASQLLWEGKGFPEQCDWLPAAVPRVLKTGLGVTYIAIGRSAHQLPNLAPLNLH